MIDPWRLARPLLHRCDPERAHGLALRAIDLTARLALPLPWPVPPGRPVKVLGLDFPNAVGLAAGFDKDAAHVDALARLGFGFLEVGTVTPRPQPGNQRPRLFRIPEAGAVINRMGFNNAGLLVFCENLARVRSPVVLGVNLGRNKDTPNEQAFDDYRKGLELVAARAGYVTINVSSPNTSGLRELQRGEALYRLLAGLRERAWQLAQGRRPVPLLVKVAPDLDEGELDLVAEAVTRSGIAGVIATNTTTARPGLEGHRLAGEAGGLSGAPLAARALAVLTGLRQRLGPEPCLIGVGGIGSGADARARIAAGADLVQIYTGLIYRGPGLVGECVAALATP